MSGEIYYIFVVEVAREVGYLKARRLVRELSGKTYFLTGLQTDTSFRFKINNKCYFDLTTLKRKKIDDEVSLIIGQLKTDRARLSTMQVIQDDSAILEDKVSPLSPTLD